MSSLPDYAELHCLSNFSFLRGASHPAELVERAHKLEYTALAITDECSVAGVVRAHEAAKKTVGPDRPGLKLIVGSEIRLEDGLTLVLLAASREGYGRLSTLITVGRRRTEKGSYRLAREDLGNGLQGCLALLVPSRVPHLGFPPAAERSTEEWNEALSQARFVADCFPGRAWIAVELPGQNDRVRLRELEALGRSSGLPLVAAGDVHMHVRSRRPLHDVLTAIRLGVPVAQAGYALQANAERRLRYRKHLADIYSASPALLAETLKIAEGCNFRLDELRYEYPDEIVPPGHTPTTYLRDLTEQG